jgi:hypothetical protein
MVSSFTSVTTVVSVVVIVLPAPLRWTLIRFLPLTFHLAGAAQDFFEFAAVEPHPLARWAEIDQHSSLCYFLHGRVALWTDHTSSFVS